MLAPSAMFIESAADSLPSVPDFIRVSQLKELSSFGAERAKRLGASGLSDDFVLGYQLGLATARAILATSGALAVKGVDPRQLL